MMKLQKAIHIIFIKNVIGYSNYYALFVFKLFCNTCCCKQEEALPLV